MFGHYLDLALRSLRRNMVLTALMVLSIGLGIGACTTMVTVLHVLSGDPMPQRSPTLFYPKLDPQDMEGYQAGEEPLDQLTWTDAMNLLRARRATRQAAMVGGQVTVRPPQGSGHAFFASARYTSADFFPMFGVPFTQGAGWSADDDEHQARVAVLAPSLAQKLFGSGSAIGKTLRLGDTDFRVIGVLGSWHPVPHFYDLSEGGYGDGEQVFVPLTTARAVKLRTDGNIECWGNVADMKHLEIAPCTWLQFWVQLNGHAQEAAYLDYLTHYSEEQKKLGRYARPPNVRLRSLMDWLNYQKVVPGNVRLETQLAFAFLLICMVNTTALLLVKFLRRGGELGVRRAMGASMQTVFAQLLVEASLVGMSGGLLGLLLAWLGLWVVRQQPAEYASLAHWDTGLLPLALLLAVATSLFAAIFPAWRACRLPPARMLKIQ